MIMKKELKKDVMVWSEISFSDSPPSETPSLSQDLYLWTPLSFDLFADFMNRLNSRKNIISATLEIYIHSGFYCSYIRNIIESFIWNLLGIIIDVLWVIFLLKAWKNISVNINKRLVGLILNSVELGQPLTVNVWLSWFEKLKRSCQKSPIL